MPYGIEVRARDLPLEKRIELYERATSLQEENNWGATRIGRELSLDMSTVYNWLCRGRCPGTNIHKTDLSPSRELSYIAGVVQGDGWVSCRKRRDRPGNRFEVGLDVTDRDFAEEFRGCLKKLTGYKYTIGRIENGNRNSDSFRVIKQGRELHDYLNKPPQQIEAVKAYPQNFVRGIFDSEGGVSGREVYCYNTERNLLVFVSNLLKSLGIQSRIRLTNQHIKKKNRKKLFRLVVIGRENIIKFYGGVGFSIRRKAEKLKERVRIYRK